MHCKEENKHKQLFIAMGNSASSSNPFDRLENPFDSKPKNKTGKKVVAQVCAVYVQRRDNFYVVCKQLASTIHNLTALSK